MKIRLKKAVEDAIDGLARNAFAKLLEQKAITADDFAKLLGVSEAQAVKLMNLPGGKILDRWRDPETGEWMITTRTARAYIERYIERNVDAAKPEEPASPYAEGPAAYTVEEYAEMAGLDPQYVFEAIHQGRVPGAVTRDGALVSGPFARRKAEELKRQRQLERSVTDVANSLADDLPAWVPIDEAARLLGMKPHYFQLGQHRNGMVVQRIPGKGTCVGGPGLQRLLDEAERRRSER